MQIFLGVCMHVYGLISFYKNAIIVKWAGDRSGTVDWGSLLKALRILS